MATHDEWAQQTVTSLWQKKLPAADAAPPAEKAYTPTAPPQPAGASAQDPAASGDLDLRRQFVHFLREGHNDPERALAAMDAMSKYLRYAKTQLEQTGKTQLILDSDIIFNYLSCEDLIIKNQTGEEVLGQAAERLAMLIQNLHHLMGFTTVRKFEHCTHNLFRRYITVCSLLGDAKRARSAWRALERTGHITMLQDVHMNMVYIETLLRASRTVRTGDRGEYLDAAMQELNRWQVRPPGERGVSVSDGHVDVSAPRYFSLHSHGNNVAHTFREALFTISTRRSPDRLLRMHEHLKQFRSLRSHIPAGDPVPAVLLMGAGQAHSILTALVHHRLEDSETPFETVEALAHFAFDDLESAMRAHDGLRRGGIRKAPQQYIDEGLVQHVLLLCVRLQSARLALAALRLLERSLSSIPVPPEEVRKLPLRPTAATGVRVPLASTYLSAIHACAEDPFDEDDTHIFEALKLVATIERLYSDDGPQPPRALDPVRLLAPLTERIGRSPEAWQRAWGHVEALDQQGALSLSHLNVMISAIAQLPDGAALDAILPGESAETAKGEAAQADNLTRKAVEVHQLAGKAFDKVTVHTYNALLAVFCRPDSSKNATQLILNLLELMAAQGVERSQETYDLLLRHWADRRIFKAVLATVEDMAAAGLTPNPQHIRSAAYDADSLGLDQEAHALREVLEDMGIPSGSQRRFPQRNFDARGRVQHNR